MSKQYTKETPTQTLLRESGPQVFSLQNYRLVVMTGPARDAEIALEQKDRITIGSGEDNDWGIADPTVSRQHCELQRFGDSFLVRDLDSTNGTQLDGTTVREAFIKPGCLIEIGSSTIKVMGHQEEFQVSASEQTTFHGLLGSSLKMREVFSVLERVAPTDTTILIQGETGTGKELVAKAVHSASRRADKPFVVFDCGAVSPTLIESELFGHERGAFTGAVGERKGAFEMANHGTIFLDEIGELSEDLQPNLLRALEQKEISRDGGETRIR